MKAALYTRARGGKVLEIEDLEKPFPKDNEVVIRVRAASVNPLDWRMKSHRPGVDVAGEVVAIGKGVTPFKPGDVVFGAGKGAFAEYASAREAKLISKPENMSFGQSRRRAHRRANRLAGASRQRTRSPGSNSKVGRQGE